MPTAAAALFEKQQEGWTFVDVLRPKELNEQQTTSNLLCKLNKLK